MKEPQPHPPKIDLHVPGTPDKLAQASVTPMANSPTLNPSNLTAEQWLLATAERHGEQLRNIEKSLDELKKSVGEMMKTHQALGWKVSGALASAFGALLAAAWGLLQHAK